MIEVQRSGKIVWMPHLFQEGWGTEWANESPCLHLQLLSILSAESGVPEHVIVKAIEASRKKAGELTEKRKTFAQFERWAKCTTSLWRMEKAADITAAIDQGRPVLWIGDCHYLNDKIVTDRAHYKPPSETGWAHTVLVIGYDECGDLIVRDSRAAPSTGRVG